MNLQCCCFLLLVKTQKWEQGDRVNVTAKFFLLPSVWTQLFCLSEKVKKELASALDSSGSICYEDRTKLPYTNAVIHEVQRLSNVMLFALPRLSVQDMYVHGHFIPKVQSNVYPCIVFAQERGRHTGASNQTGMWFCKRFPSGCALLIFVPHA